MFQRLLARFCSGRIPASCTRQPRLRQRAGRRSQPRQIIPVTRGSKVHSLSTASYLRTLAAVIPVALFGVPASGAIYTVGFFGVLDSGTYHPDTISDFIDMGGAPYRVEFAIDDSKATSTEFVDSTVNVLHPVVVTVSVPSFSYSAGATAYTTQANRFVKIDGRSTNDLIGGQAEDTPHDTYFTSKEGRNLILRHYGYVAAFIGETNGTGTLIDSAEFGAAFARALDPSDEIHMDFAFYDDLGDPLTGLFQVQRDFVGKASTGTFFSTRVDSGIPEPGTWAMMIAGLGLIGAASRRATNSPRKHA